MPRTKESEKSKSPKARRARRRRVASAELEAVSPAAPAPAGWQPEGERLACRDTEAYKDVVQELLEYELDHGGSYFMASVLDSRGLAVYLPEQGVSAALRQRLRVLAGQ